jgi:mannosyltransferase
VRYRKLLAFILLLLTLELLFHISTFTIRQPLTTLDAPFSASCGPQTDNSTVRENATLVMLARNSEVDDAIASVLSVQEQFNNQFGYGWVFLNDKEWTAEFKTKVSQAIGGRAEAKFEKIPESMWGYPPWINQDKAARKMRDMQKAEIMYAGTESYHHMCRFQSG